MRNCILRGFKALVGAVLLVLLTKAFVFVSCTIPSTGMENSLYEGERVLVNKWSYGLRLPFTTYRLGQKRASKGDVVLFNNPLPQDSSVATFLREPFLSRCAAIPGDNLLLNDAWWPVYEQLYLPRTKYLYLYDAQHEEEVKQLLEKVGIHNNPLVGYSAGNNIRSLSRDEYWSLQQVLPKGVSLSLLYKVDDENNRTLVIPAKGASVAIEPWNASLYCNAIQHHEGKEALVKNDTLFVEGKPTSHYTFTKDYYWMLSNDPVNQCDSRQFGLVPEDHLIGKVWLVWYSSRQDRLFQTIEQ
ncbi:MAG: signal peptidase I [Phocaeicola sp.]